MMKSPEMLRFQVTLFLFIGSASLWGTPDRSINVSERLLGSNSQKHAILRTEIDNLGTYYDSQTKQDLDIYSKRGSEENEHLAHRFTSILLLNYAAGGHPDGSALPQIIIFKNEKFLLADLLPAFPNNPWRWGDEKPQRFKDQSSGDISFGHLYPVRSSQVRTYFGKDTRIKARN